MKPSLKLQSCVLWSKATDCCLPSLQKKMLNCMEVSCWQYSWRQHVLFSFWFFFYFILSSVDIFCHVSPCPEKFWDQVSFLLQVVQVCFFSVLKEFYFLFCLFVFSVVLDYTLVHSFTVQFWHGHVNHIILVSVPYSCMSFAPCACSHRLPVVRCLCFKSHLGAFLSL